MATARWTCALVLTLATLVIAGGRAAAQAGDVERSAAARALFNEGVQLSDRGQWSQAADRFGRALEMRATPQIRFNLAQALSHTGHLVEASEHCLLVERDADAPDDVKALARTLREQITPRIGRLVIRVRGNRGAADVEIDGKPVPEALIGVAAPANPGTHRVTLEVEGNVIDERRVEVPEGGTAGVELAARGSVAAPHEVAEASAGQETATAPIVAAEPDDDGEESSGIFASPWFWIGVAVVAGGAAAGVYFATRADPQGASGDFDPPRLEIR